MPNLNKSEQSGRMVDHKTSDPLGATTTETPKSLAEKNEGTTKTILSSSDDSSDDDDLIIMSTNSSSAQITTSADVVGALGATYAPAVNGVRCFLSSEDEYAELLQSDLLLQETCFEKYRYKLVNNYARRPYGERRVPGSRITLPTVTSLRTRPHHQEHQQQQQPCALSVVRSKHKPATEPANCLQPAEATISSGDGSSVHPLTIDVDDEE
ncbi:hypothetical protein BZA05DRAFT_417476 [Tricharina praecox]|uniref:uncharacterized protein n=1 Tax=Tricharina praecox TaxID=43433 RepID=UPI00221EF79F|nr:uncharacterized protein BZA05DRAFT_417476 [Tricharina praecox]KAI5854114.1 hypothetical protein BZA05DRAFT_417476 [Tricharina praecox]